MSNDGKSEKAQDDVRDTVAEETKDDVRDTVTEDLGEEKYFTNQAEKLREKGSEIVEDDKSTKAESRRIKRESDTLIQNRANRAINEKGKGVFNIMSRKPIVTVVIIGVLIVGILIYAFGQYGNQSYKAEIFNASWNQSLVSLRNGNVSVTEYCNQNPHDQKLCDIFWKLKYM